MTSTKDGNLQLLWNEFASKIRERFSLKPIEFNSQMVIPATFKDMFSELDDSNEILPGENEKTKPLPIRGAVAYKCMKSALSNLNLCSECINDISLEFAREQLDNSEAKIWLQFWKQWFPRSKIAPNLAHDPSKYYPYLHNLIGDEGLEQIVKELAVLTRSQITMDFHRYVQYLQRRYRRFKTTLDKTELSIVQFLLQNPNSSVKEIAQYIGCSIQWVSVKLGELRNRTILRVFDWPHFANIGIRLFYVFLNSLVEYTDPQFLVQDCPFLYTYQNILSGQGDALAVFAVPDNETSLRSLDHFVKLARRWKVDVEIFEVVASEKFYNFTFYNPSRKRWHIPWQRFLLQTKRGTLPKVDNVKKLVRPRKHLHIRLDELDLQIIDAVRRKVGGISKVRKVVGAGQNIVARRLKRLKKEGIIERKWEVHNIGLSDNIIVQSVEESTSQILVGLALELPHSIFAFDEFENLTMILFLPAGNSLRFLEIVKTLNPEVFVAFLDDPIYGDWGIPIELWNEQSQSWMCPLEKIKIWFSYIG